mmetsp:Transcript_10027/g.16867  ORF Transcript_10027/g.16867 Transcript_10027/m.16867 type:complete len:94 (-) Transcript_10027:162-443(-)
MLQSFIDSYLLVANALTCLVETGVTLEEDKLIDELHVQIKRLCEGQVIRYMNSCHKETLANAFGRFAELGLSQRQVFISQVGKKNVYIKAQAS